MCFEVAIVVTITVTTIDYSNNTCKLTSTVSLFECWYWITILIKTIMTILLLPLMTIDVNEN